MDRDAFKDLVRQAHQSLSSVTPTPKLGAVYEAVARELSYKKWDVLSACLASVAQSQAEAAIERALVTLKVGTTAAPGATAGQKKSGFDRAQARQQFRQFAKALPKLFVDLERRMGPAIALSEEVRERTHAPDFITSMNEAALKQFSAGDFFDLMLADEDAFEADTGWRLTTSLPEAEQLQWAKMAFIELCKPEYQALNRELVLHAFQDVRRGLSIVDGRDSAEQTALNRTLVDYMNRLVLGSPAQYDQTLHEADAKVLPDLANRMPDGSIVDQRSSYLDRIRSRTTVAVAGILKSLPYKELVEHGASEDLSWIEALPNAHVAETEEARERLKHARAYVPPSDQSLIEPGVRQVMSPIGPMLIVKSILPARVRLDDGRESIGTVTLWFHPEADQVLAMLMSVPGKPSHLQVLHAPADAWVNATVADLGSLVAVEMKDIRHPALQRMVSTFTKNFGGFRG